MFRFRKPRRFCSLFPDSAGWIAVHADGRKVGYVRRESPGRWIGAFSRKVDDGQRQIVGATRDAVADALLLRVRAGAEGTGET